MVYQESSRQKQIIPHFQFEPHQQTYGRAPSSEFTSAHFRLRELRPQEEYGKYAAPKHIQETPSKNT
jgi:hypothetical protein